MCYDDIEEVGRRVEDVRVAKTERELWQSEVDSDGERLGGYTMNLTKTEVTTLLDARLAKASARLSELVTPVKRVEPGDRAKEIEALNARKGLPSQEA